MADQAGQVNAFKRAWPSPKPPAVKAGTKKRGTSCTTDSVRLAEADNLIAGRSLGMVVLCAADVYRFRQGKGALTHPPPPTSPALKTHATFLCSARPSRRFGQLRRGAAETTRPVKKSALKSQLVHFCSWLRRPALASAADTHMLCPHTCRLSAYVKI